MSQNVKTEASAPPARQNDKSSSWADALPMSVDKEDTMNAKDVNICWNKILKAIGLTSASESERKLVKAGVYVYGALNGTSRAGLYNGKITMANGTSFSASVIPIATGKYDIRRFSVGVQMILMSSSSQLVLWRLMERWLLRQRIWVFRPEMLLLWLIGLVVVS